VSILHRWIFSFDVLVCRERDLVRRWPAPVEMAPPFICLGLPIRFARVTEIAGDCQDEYETLKPQKETVAAVMPHRVFHPSPRKNLSSLF
jgi:hypothetical protein